LQSADSVDQVLCFAFDQKVPMSQTATQSNITNPDSLQVSLSKVKAISTVNQESLEFIESRKGQQVITQRKYVLEPKQSPQQKRRKLNGLNETNENMISLIENDLVFTSHDTKQDIDSIIENWRYTGDTLKKEHIAIHHFIDTHLSIFDDLLRIQSDYEKLINVYSRILVDQPESRAAVSVVMENMELLQVAIGEIHEKMIDKQNDIEGDSDIQECVSLVAKGITRIREKGVSFSMNLSGVTESVRKDTLTNLVEFDDVTKIKWKRTYLSSVSIDALVLCVVDGVDYVVTGDYSDEIKLWKIGKDEDHFSLKKDNCNRDYIYSLVSYHRNDMTMLAVGCASGDIMIWNLSSKRFLLTLSEHTSKVYALQIYEKHCKMYLISGCRNGDLVIWDLDTYDLVKKVDCGISQINALTVYSNDGTDHVIIGVAEGIDIWRLDQYAKVAELDTDTEYTSLAVTRYNGILMVAGGTSDGQVKVWNLENHQLVGEYTACEGWEVGGLDWIISKKKICLVSNSEDASLKVWDMESKEIISTINTGSIITCLTVMEMDICSYILTGDTDGNTMVWQE